MRADYTMAMTDAAATPPHDIAIIGGGAAGTLVAIQLLRQATHALRIVLIEPSALVGEGVAYATRHPGHLLNVPAGGMSAFPDQADDFVAYLRARDIDDEPGDPLGRRFVGRRDYAGYLQQRLAEARSQSPAELQVLRDRVTALEKHADACVLQLQSDVRLRAAAVVLATGNALRPLPARGATTLDAAQRIEAWDNAAVAAIPVDSAVCIVGSGLSMVDALVTLQHNGHRGPIHVLSRHGLLPLPHLHEPTVPADVDIDALCRQPLRMRLHALRAQARVLEHAGRPWQPLMDALRPHVQALWASLSSREQRQFLRRAVRYWDVHRHRIAPQVHAQVMELLARGQLCQHRARLDTVYAHGACVRVGAVDVHGLHHEFDVHHVINATGVEMRVQAMRNPLLQQLLGSGLAIAGPHGIGVDSAADGALVAADGRTDPCIRVIGSLRIGRLWESLAIPELRAQAEAIARALLDRQLA